MPFHKTDFPGLLIFEPFVFEDDRGYFFESYNESAFTKEGINLKFVQDNQARSAYGVVRGLHFQHGTHAQAKLIRVINGLILDVVIDIRKGSPSYGNVFSIELSAENKKQLLIPKGFAHGYSVLSETAEVFYKCDRLYNKDAEGGIRYNDPVLRIDWGIPESKILVSSKDKVYPTLAECDHGFNY
jgi:dTDP-4-dehydrorhamnose 3,5-epimerase